MSDEKLPVSTTPLPDAGPIDSHVGGGGGDEESALVARKPWHAPSARSLDISCNTDSGPNFYPSEFSPYAGPS